MTATRPLAIINVSSLEDAINSLDIIISSYADQGVLVLRGYRFSTEEQVSFTKHMGSLLGWNIDLSAADTAVNSAVYFGGHSDNPEKEYNQSANEYVLDWHIEQVYYVHPILAGVWSMTNFTAPKAHGNTRFVDSIELLEMFNSEDREFLSKAVVVWDKDAPNGIGPYYTRVVDTHPILKKPQLRVETDQGCKAFPELFLWDNKEATEDQKNKFKELQKVIKDTLNNNEDIRFSQEWREGDLLIVDLFRMYHSVMGGFSFGERNFTGIGLRPKIYDDSLYNNLDLL